MKKIHSKNAPGAIGPYSQAVQGGNLVFCSGQIPIVPKTGEIVEGGVREQAKQVLENLIAVLKAADCTLENVAKTTVYLKDMKDFVAVNEVYAQYFNFEILPARVAFQVAELPKGSLVEIDAIACKE